MIVSDHQAAYREPEFVSNYEDLRFSSIRGRIYRELHQRIVSKFLSQVPEGSVVLDVPCGTGRLAPLVSEHGLGYCGGDASEAMTRHTHSTRSSLNGFSGVATLDVGRLPFVDRKFAAVLCIKLTHLLPPESLQRVVKECERVTDRYVVFDFGCQNAWSPFVYATKRLLHPGSIQERALNEKQIRSIIGEAGLLVREFKYVCRPLSDAVVVLCEKNSAAELNPVEANF